MKTNNEQIKEEKSISLIKGIEKSLEWIEKRIKAKNFRKGQGLEEMKTEGITNDSKLKHYETSMID